MSVTSRLGALVLQGGGGGEGGHTKAILAPYGYATVGTPVWPTNSKPPFRRFFTKADSTKIDSQSKQNQFCASPARHHAEIRSCRWAGMLSHRATSAQHQAFGMTYGLVKVGGGCEWVGVGGGCKWGMGGGRVGVGGIGRMGVSECGLVEESGTRQQTASVAAATPLPPLGGGGWSRFATTALIALSSVCQIACSGQREAAAGGEGARSAYGNPFFPCSWRQQRPQRLRQPCVLPSGGCTLYLSSRR